MKKFLLFALSAIILIGCSDNSTNNYVPGGAWQKETLPKGNYSFNVRSSFDSDASGALGGTKAYLDESGWADVMDGGENYMIWVSDLVRTKKSNGSVSVDFNLILGDVLTSDYTKHFQIEYTPDADVYNVGDLTAQVVMNGYGSVIDNISKLKFNSIPGIKEKTSTQAATAKIMSFVYMWDETGKKYYQSEAVYVGAYCYNQIREWILEMENNY